jgi:histidinol-phosphate aminotransferase
VPGKPIETLEREYGISDSIKLASNENPLGPSPRAVAAVRGALDKLHRYPDGAGHLLTHRLARFLSVAPEQIVIGNGSDDIMALLARVLLQPGDEVVVPQPSFLLYTVTAQSACAVPVAVPLKRMAIDLEAMRANVGERTRLIFICNPNNPTGTVVSRSAFESFLASLPKHVVVVVDEAYIEFVRDPSCFTGISYLDADIAVVTLRTFSKLYGLAGLRIGYGVMPRELADMLHRVRMPFNVNSLAQAAAVAALDDTEFTRRTLEVIHSGLDDLYAGLDRRKINYYPTQSNFFLVDVDRDADEVFEAMLRQGVIVRSMRSYGYPRFIRVNVGLPTENARLLEALDRVLGTTA